MSQASLRDLEIVGLKSQNQNLVDAVMTQRSGKERIGEQK